jgi:hypothetical protein
MQMLSELPAPARLAYRILTPLITGAGLVTALLLLFEDPLRNSDAPEWMSSLPLRLGTAAIMLGYMSWLSWRVSEVPCWAGIEDDALHLKTLWSRHVRSRPLCDIQDVKIVRRGPSKVLCKITFRDGIHFRLEGRMGPGWALLFARELRQSPGRTS